MNVWRSFGLLSRASILRSYAPMNASMYPITNSVLTYNQADLSQDPLPSVIAEPHSENANYTDVRLTNKKGKLARKKRSKKKGKQVSLRYRG